MKTSRTITAWTLAALLHAAPATAENPKEDFRTRAEELAESQDNLSADVQQLVLEQTHPQVIELLGQVEDIMDEVVEKLAEADTGGDTLAAQTEIIEKIYEAAKQKQQQGGGSGKSGGAMMDMMERMMGKKNEGQGKGDKPGKEGEGNQGREGSTGESDSANQGTNGSASGPREIRRVPKASGNSGADIPAEFRKAMDAYNRGLESNLK